MAFARKCFVCKVMLNYQHDGWNVVSVKNRQICTICANDVVESLKRHNEIRRQAVEVAQ